MTRILLPLFLLLGLIGAVVVFTPSQKDEMHDDAQATATQDLDLEAVLEIQEPQQNLNIIVERTAIESSEADALGSRADSGGSILVTVIDRNNQRLPGATVYVIDHGKVQLATETVDLFRQQSLTKAFALLGKAHHTNEDAQVHIPKPLGKLALAGSTLQHFGSTNQVVARQGQVTLTLDFIEAIPVQVVNREGTPVANAQVNLRQDGVEVMNGLVGGITDSAGMTSVQLSWEIKRRLSKHEKTTVALNLLGTDAVEKVVDLNNLPEEPIVLVMPPTGSVEVLVVDVKNQPVSGLFQVWVTSLTKRTDGIADWTHSKCPLVGVTEQGKVVFPHVALGLLLRAETRFDRPSKSSKMDLLGPQRSGERIYFTVSGELEYPVLVGRILNTEGMVARNLTFDTRLHHHFGGQQQSIKGAKLQTDAEGKFRWPVLETYKPGTKRNLTITMRPTKRKALRTVEVDLSQMFEPSEVDLGDLVVDVPPVLVRGRVIDDVGNPIRNAQIRIERETPVRNSTNRTYWDSVKYWSSTVDRHGNFEIRGHAEDGRLRLQVTEAQHATAVQEVRIGDIDVELVMGKSITVSGRVLLDSNINPKSIHVRLQRPSLSNVAEPYNQSVRIGSNGKFRFLGQPQVFATIRVRSAAFREDLLVFENVQLHATGKEMILPDIDLRGLLTTATISVVDENGKAMDGAWVRISGMRFTTHTEGRPLTITRRNGSFALEVGDERKRSVLVTDVDGDLEVVLSESGLQAKIHLSNANLLPPDWQVYGAILFQLENGKADTTRSQILNFDPDYSSDVTLPLPGTYSVKFSIVHYGGTTASKMHDLGDSSSFTKIEVRDSSTLQEFYVTMDQDELNEAIAKTLAWESEQ